MRVKEKDEENDGKKRNTYIQSFIQWMRKNSVEQRNFLLSFLVSLNTLGNEDAA